MLIAVAAVVVAQLSAAVAVDCYYSSPAAVVVDVAGNCSSAVVEDNAVDTEDVVAGDGLVVEHVEPAGCEADPDVQYTAAVVVVEDAELLVVVDIEAQDLHGLVWVWPQTCWESW